MTMSGIFVTIWRDLCLAVEVAYIYITKGW